MLCFSHLMQPETVEAVIDNRLGEIERYKKIFKSIEESSDVHRPAGMQFVLGFGKAVSAAMEHYINANRHLLAVPAEEPAAKNTPR